MVHKDNEWHVTKGHKDGMCKQQSGSAVTKYC